MKFANTIIGLFVILVGFLLVFTTVYDEPLKTTSINIIGLIIAGCGLFYLKKIAEFGRQ